MSKILRFVFVFLFFLFFTHQPVFAQNSFVSVVNPVRGYDFWDQKDQKIDTVVLGESEVLKKFNISATWLVR